MIGYVSWLTRVGVLTSAVVLATSMPLAGQLVPEHPISQMDLKIRTVRDYDQPVLPIFEGWYTNEDGSYDLCFGYFSLNRIEEVDIPVGPDNFIEPDRFKRASAHPLRSSGTPRFRYGIRAGRRSADGQPPREQDLRIHRERPSRRGD